MKRALFFCVLLLSVVATARATVTINLAAGVLYNANGTTPQGSGMLVQLIVSTADNIFSPVTSASFTGGSSDDVIIGSFVTDANGSVASPLVLTLSGNLAAGQQILLRWFPTITGGVGTPSAPPAGSPYGQFRTDLVENFSSTRWVLPADGATIDLNFFTPTLNPASPEPESAGRAIFTVMAIPEPATSAFVIVGLAGAVFMRRRARIA